MIERMDLFHLPFYKKEAFTGSDRGVRFWIGKADILQEEGEEKSDLVLRAVLWPEPFALQATPKEQQIQKDFSFSEEGLDDAYAWITGKGREEILKTDLQT